MKPGYFMILFSTLFVLSCVQHQAGMDISGEDRVTVPLTVSKSGHILTTAEINGKKAYLMIDTGASSSVIHIGKIDSLGLECRDKKGKASGIGTSNYDMKEVIVPEMILNSVSYSNPEFDGLDLFHVERVDHNQTLDGIIGGDFLEKYEAVIDYRKKAMFLKKPW